MTTLKQKLTISLMSAGVFMLVALPATFKFTNGLIGGITKNGSPTLLGLALHAGLFFVLTRITMKGAPYCAATKRKRSLIAAALFGALNSGVAKGLSRKMLGVSGMKGLMVHAAVYAGILVMLMGR